MLRQAPVLLSVFFVSIALTGCVTYESRPVKLGLDAWADQALDDTRIYSTFNTLQPGPPWSLEDGLSLHEYTLS